jgi:hypothetical protein
VKPLSHTSISCASFASIFIASLLISSLLQPKRIFLDDQIHDQPSQFRRPLADFPLESLTQHLGSRGIGLLRIGRNYPCPELANVRYVAECLPLGSDKNVSLAVFCVG